MDKFDLIVVTQRNEQAVSGRRLYEALGIKAKYSDWFPRMCDYGFAEGTDFYSNLSRSSGGRPATDHIMSLDMAKHLAMLTRNDKGKEIRNYFIQKEKEWNEPSKVISRALLLANKQLNQLPSDKNIKMVTELLWLAIVFLKNVLHRLDLPSVEECPQILKNKVALAMEGSIENV